MRREKCALLFKGILYNLTMVSSTGGFFVYKRFKYHNFSFSTKFLVRLPLPFATFYELLVHSVLMRSAYDRAIRAMPPARGGDRYARVSRYGEALRRAGAGL